MPNLLKPLLILTNFLQYCFTEFCCWKICKGQNTFAVAAAGQVWPSAGRRCDVDGRAVAAAAVVFLECTVWSVRVQMGCGFSLGLQW